MSTDIRQLEPKSLWNHFADLNAVPRASKKEERVIQFMLDFGEKLGLDTHKDHIGNVIIRKPATAGMESRQTLVMQSHLDMVHQKNDDTQFDFATEGIRMLVDNDWVRADGTTLGADNGIGVATIMALLSSKDIEHPAIEALFTIDEETGMTGALELKAGLLTGSILLNLDTEDDRELTIGCAGGVDVSATGTYEEMDLQNGFSSFELKVKGLKGGHSGMDIHKGLGNANKIMNRLLYRFSSLYDLRLQSVDGGGLRNAIPRESTSIFFIKDDQLDAFAESARDLFQTIKKEHFTTDPDLKFELDSAKAKNKMMHPQTQRSFLRSIYACPNGIYRMSPDIEHLVQTSNNVARVLLKDGKYEILCLTRSSVDSEKDDLADAIRSCFEMLGANVDTSGSYPGWTPKPSAPIIQTMSNVYVEMFDEPPHVNACHAGLECGIIGTNYPDMDMISFGPNIRGAHSPDECVQISSVQKYWKYTLEVLKRTPMQS